MKHRLVATVTATTLALAGAALTGACGGHASSPDPAQPQAAPAESAEATPVGPAEPAEATPVGPDESAPADPAPETSPSSGAAPAPAEASSPSAAAGCVVKLVLDAKRVRFEGGGTQGGVPLRHVDKLKDALAPAAAAHCSAEITAGAHVRYGDVVQVMDQLRAAGIHDMALASAGTAPSAPAAPAPASSRLSDDPVVVVTVHDVLVNGVSLHRRPSAADLEAAVHKALAEGRSKHPGGAVIVQADRNAPHGAVVHIVDGARAAGYVNVLFAVKTK